MSYQDGENKVYPNILPPVYTGPNLEEIAEHTEPNRNEPISDKSESPWSTTAEKLLPIAPSVADYMENGLEYLMQVDRIIVNQKVPLLEAATGLKISNKYLIKDHMGRKLFTAIEDVNCFGSIFCGSGRAFIIRIFDSSKNETLLVKRPVSYQTCCFPTCFCVCTQIVEVCTSDGKMIGTVEQEWCPFLPKFNICNEKGECVLKVVGPFFMKPFFCGERNFSIYTKDKSTVIGNITKQWGGIIKEFFTDSDDYEVSFPMDLDYKIKGVLLGACFLIIHVFKRLIQEDSMVYVHRAAGFI